MLAVAEAPRALLKGGDNVPQCCREIAKRENEADKTTREVLTALRRTFITPLDRGNIKDLITSMDDAIDQMNQTAKLAAGQRPFAAEEADDRAHGVSPSGATAWRSPACAPLRRVAAEISAEVFYGRGGYASACSSHLSYFAIENAAVAAMAGEGQPLAGVRSVRADRRCAQPAALDYGLGAQGGRQSMAERLKEAVLGVTKIPENLARAA
jgi:Protein of unknown function DUF47